MTTTVTTDRRQAVAEAAYRIRHHVPQHGRGAGPGLRRAGAGCRRHAGHRRRRPAALPGRRSAWDGRDRFLPSTGHYAIGLYAALAEAGIVPEAELDSYGSDGTPLPMSGMASDTPGMEISGGSLGTRSGRGRRDGAGAAAPGLGAPG